MTRIAAATACLFALAAGTPPAPAQEAGARAFVGATVWDGTGADPIEDAVLLVRDGRVVALGPAGAVEVPAEAEVIGLAGRWVVPGLVNAHGHVGAARGLDGGAVAHDRANILGQLGLNARYGVTTVVSLGEPGYEGVAVSAEQDDPGLDRARLFVAGPVVGARTPEQAEAEVAERAARGVDWAKIRVDSFLGRVEKMDPATYTAVIEAATAHGLPLAAHVVELEDAKGVVRAGAAILAHSVRDRAVDDELIALMRERDVCLHPTLTREVSTFVYAERPGFFDDPFFRAEADPEVIAELERPERQAAFEGPAADYFRAALPLAAANMMALHEAGVRIAFGTDSGQPARFQGAFEHMEMAMMQDAGMSPREVLRAATGVAADCMRLEGVGVLAPGAWADFVVLRADPLVDVRNLREIEAVRIAGNPVPGAGPSSD